MADNRKIKNHIRGTGKTIFKYGMEDDLAAAVDQTRLDELKAEGVIEGDWKSTKRSENSVSGDAPGKEFAERATDKGISITDNQAENFEPLSVEETLKRFREMDYSDEVMRSMQFHQETIKAQSGNYQKSEEQDARTGGSEKSRQKENDPPMENNPPVEDDEFPVEFPSRSKFIKADKTFAEVKKMNREQLIEIDGIAEKTADDVLAYFAPTNKK